MFIELTKSQFMDIFHNSDRKDSFSYDALSALYDHLNENEDYEFDLAEICGNYSEMTIKEFADYYGIDCEQAVTDYINRHGSWYKLLKESIVYESF